MGDRTSAAPPVHIRMSPYKMLCGRFLSTRIAYTGTADAATCSRCLWIAGRSALSKANQAREGEET